jgi:hypothetical protein
MTAIACALHVPLKPLPPPLCSVKPSAMGDVDTPSNDDLPMILLCQRRPFDGYETARPDEIEFERARFLCWHIQEQALI